MQFAGVILLAAIFLACASCVVGCSAGPTYPPENTQVVVIMSRRPKTGEYEAFEIRDKAMIERLKSAVKQDLRSPDPFEGHGVGLLSMHTLAFRSAVGEIVIYDVLGSKAILSDSSRHPAGNTLAALEEAKSQGKVVAISSKRAADLVPYFDVWGS